MRRRDFVTLLGGAAVAWPIAAHAQRPARVRRLGMLNGYDGNNPLFQSYVAETLQALSQLGWERGRNLEVIERWTGGDIDQAKVMAKELVALQPDVIYAYGNVAVALQMETRVIPIVFLDRDPVGSGLVASLAPP